MTVHRFALTASAVLIPLLVLVGGPPAGAAETVLLRLKFEQGSTSRMIVTMDGIMDIDSPGKGPVGSMKGKILQLYEILLHVADVRADGGVVLDLTYDRIKQSMNMGPIRLTVDTRDLDAARSNPMAAAMLSGIKPLLGLRLVITLDPDYRVTKVEGFDAFWRTLAEDPMGRVIGKQLAQTFGDAQLKNMLDQCFSRYLPNKAVAVGESWVGDYQMEIPMLGKVQIHSTNTLEGVEKHKGKRCAKIRLSAQMKSTGTQPSTIGTGIGNARIRKADTKGICWFDLDAGQMIETRLDQDLRMSMALRAPMRATTKPAKKMSIEQRMKVKLGIVVRPEPTTRPQ
jgi:hypothetical protein